MNLATLTTLNHATRLADLALRYRDALLETSDHASCDAMLAEVALLDAVEVIWPDTVKEIRDTRADELGSEYGITPDGSDVEREGSVFDPSFVHPDNPCQSGGWRTAA